jgi:hypothetical protein
MKINFYPQDKIPFVWIIDESNVFVTEPFRTESPFLIKGRHHDSRSVFTFVNYLIEEFNNELKVSFPFIVAPQYSSAGLKNLWKFETPITLKHLQPFHNDFQSWIDDHQECCEVVVHGWTHKIYNFDPSYQNLPPDPKYWEYTRRSEFFLHPYPERNFSWIVDTLEGLGYHVKTNVFSSPGGRVDKETLKKLRNSKYQVIGKYVTQLRNFPVDYGVETEFPLYLPGIDVFVFPWNLGPPRSLKEVDNLVKRKIPLFYINHAYEPTEAYKYDLRTIKTFQYIYENYSDEIVFMKMSEYSEFLHKQVVIG